MSARRPPTRPGPARVLILRHAEKLETGLLRRGGPHLSLRGSARAAALPTLFCPGLHPRDCALSASGARLSGTYSVQTLAGTSARLAMPDFVFAAAGTPTSNRSVETVAPLVAAFGLPLDSSYDEHDDDQMIASILGQSRYAGQVVLICWHHGQIPQIATAFGVAGPPPWPRHVFDRVWQLTWGAEDGPPAFTDLPQRLLFGDSET